MSRIPKLSRSLSEDTCLLWRSHTRWSGWRSAVGCSPVTLFF